MIIIHRCYGRTVFSFSGTERARPWLSPFLSQVFPTEWFHDSTTPCRWGFLIFHGSPRRWTRVMESWDGLPSSGDPQYKYVRSRPPFHNYHLWSEHCIYLGVGENNDSIWRNKTLDMFSNLSKMLMPLFLQPHGPTCRFDVPRKIKFDIVLSANNSQKDEPLIRTRLFEGFDLWLSGRQSFESAWVYGLWTA